MYIFTICIDPNIDFSSQNELVLQCQEFLADRKVLKKKIFAEKKIF